MLPDSFSDWYQEKLGIPPSEATITHCKRELIQALWLLILSLLTLWRHTNMEFSSALLTISSAVCSLNFLHIWLITLKSKLLMYVLGLCSYTLNKVLMACVRNLGICPCPRCLIKRGHIHDLGTAVDRRRRAKLRVRVQFLWLQNSKFFRLCL